MPGASTSRTVPGALRTGPFPGSAGDASSRHSRIGDDERRRNLPSSEFKRKSRIGNYGDKLMEGDYRVVQILDALMELGVDDDTLLVLASDNGPSGELQIIGGARRRRSLPAAR